MPSIVTEDAPLPSAFTWRTCNAYAVPFVSPVITIGEFKLGATTQVDPPSREYSFRTTALPPLFPALNATESFPSPGVIAVIAGALGAQAMGDIRAFGLDSAVPAAFLGLVWPRLTGNFERGLAIGCALFAVAMTPILPAGLPIIATAFIAIAVGLKR